MQFIHTGHRQHTHTAAAAHSCTHHQHTHTSHHTHHTHRLPSHFTHTHCPRFHRAALAHISLGHCLKNGIQKPVFDNQKKGLTTPSTGTPFRVTHISYPFLTTRTSTHTPGTPWTKGPKTTNRTVGGLDLPLFHKQDGLLETKTGVLEPHTGYHTGNNIPRGLTQHRGLPHFPFPKGNHTPQRG